jgi:hemerythrin
MPIVKWNAGLLTGIKDIDENNRRLLLLLSESFDDFGIGSTTENNFIDDLFNCMANCFDCEETLMIKKSYPFFSEHKAEHEIFTQRFLEIYGKQDADTYLEIMVFLNNWITHHIGETDTKFGNFVEALNFRKRQKK